MLKEQLHSLTRIAICDQVLILCDLSDTERNSDKILQGLDDLTLRECNIKADSFLTLHALGVKAEAEQNSKLSADETDISKKKDNVVTLDTPITAAQADHRLLRKATYVCEIITLSVLITVPFKFCQIFNPYEHSIITYFLKFFTQIFITL